MMFCDFITHGCYADDGVIYIHTAFQMIRTRCGYLNGPRTENGLPSDLTSASAFTFIGTTYIQD